MKKVLLLALFAVTAVLCSAQNLRFKGIDQKDKTCFWVEKTLVELGCKFKEYDGGMKMFNGTYAGRKVVIGVSGVPQKYDPTVQVENIIVFIDDVNSVTEWDAVYIEMKEALISKCGEPFTESYKNALWMDSYDRIFLTYTETGVAISFTNNVQEKKAKREKELELFKKHDDM